MSLPVVNPCEAKSRCLLLRLAQLTDDATEESPAYPATADWGELISHRYWCSQSLVGHMVCWGADEPEMRPGSCRRKLCTRRLKRIFVKSIEPDRGFLIGIGDRLFLYNPVRCSAERMIDVIWSHLRS